MSTTTLPLISPRRRATDDPIPQGDLADDEFAVSPGTHQWSGNGHEHKPDDRGVIKCATCVAAQRYAKKGVNPQRLVVGMDLSVEQYRAFEQRCSGAGLSATELLRRFVIDEAEAQTKAPGRLERRAGVRA